MGRELRRVPLDFQWPLNKPWNGFINPHHKPCPATLKNECHGGYTNGGRWLDAVCRFLALLGEQAVSEPYATQLRARGQIFPHPYLRGFAQAPMASPMFTEMLPLTEEIATFITGLAGGERPRPSLSGCGYSWVIQKNLLKAAGIDPNGKFGTCLVCDGHGIDPAAREAYESWEKEPPPTGDGWQLWETVSEGSPISKVYTTRESFIAYLVGEGYATKSAEAFCESGWAPSAIITSGGTMLRDIESCK